jgi:hypothetical protein
MKEALDAQLAGDEEKASKLLKLLAPENPGEPTKKPKVMVTPKSPGHTIEEQIQENGMSFMKAGINSFLEMGLPSFFDKNMKELKGKPKKKKKYYDRKSIEGNLTLLYQMIHPGPLPITIFNKAWQDAAVLYHSEKRPRAEELSTDKDKYTGLRYPSEWEQTFGEWTINHRGFHAALKDIYKFPTFAGWLLEHKAHADRIHAKDGYMAALRYDVHLRTNAFAHKVTRNGVEGVPDISVFRPDIAESAYADARRFEELGFKDNPYAPGGLRDGIDPVTGLPKPKSKEASFAQQTQPTVNSSIPFATTFNQVGYANQTRIQTQQYQNPSNYAGYSLQPRYNQPNQWNQGPQRPPRQRGRNGYRGNNFNPQYQEQRRNGNNQPTQPGNGQMVLRDNNNG